MKHITVLAAFLFAITISAHAETVADYQKMAQQKENDNDYAGAIAIYDGILKQYPKQFPDLYADRAEDRYELNDYKGAIADFTKALALDSANKPADQVLNRGVVLKKRGDAKRYSGDYKGAIADYNQSLVLDPKDTELLSNRADVRLKIGDCAGAIHDYSTLLELDNGSIISHEGRAVARICTGDLQAALEDERIAVQQNKDLDATIPQRVVHGLYLSTWALAVRLGHKDDADTALSAELAAADTPSGVGQTYNAARYLLGQSDEAALFRDVEALKVQQPKFSESFESDAYFYVALKRLGEGNKVEALKAFQKVLTFHQHTVTVAEQASAWIKELNRKPH